MPDPDPTRKFTPSIPTLRDLLMVLFRRRRTFVWVAGLVFAVSLWYAVTGTKYQANMKILVRRGRAEPPLSAALNAPLDLTRVGITEEELNSEVELLRDHDVLRKVVEQNGSSGRDWLHVLHLREGRAQRIERATRRLAEQLRVQPVKKTNLIAISYRAADAESAARLLRCVAAAYLEKHTAVHRPAGELSFFEKQTEESRKQVEESSRRLLLFTKGHGIIAAAQQRDMAIQKLSALEADQRQVRIDMAETRQRIVELEELLTSLPQRTITQVRTSENAELLRSLKASLLDLQLKRTQLLTKFEPNHRLVEEVSQQIGEAEAAIAVESASPLRDETSDKNVNYEWASSGLQSAQVQWRALQARETATVEQAAVWRRIAGELGEDAITQDDLLSARNAAQETYLLYSKKREEARMNDALDERGIVNVAIAEEPVAPALPLLSMWIVLAMGLTGAAVAGGVSSFAVDYLDPTFRDPDDVVNCLNLAVLASLPQIGNSRLAA
jgi:polysaccharide biosynthesis protein PslE